MFGIKKFINWLLVATPTAEEQVILDRISRAKKELPSMRVDQNGAMLVDVGEVMRSSWYKEHCRRASNIVKRDVSQ